jgi:Tfp pilus assembly protein PilZ
MVIKVEEKRNFPRVNLRTNIRYQVRGESEFSNTLTENIGIGGAALTDEKFIAPSTPLMLEINILSRILRLIGKVAWVSPLPHSDRNRLGIEFLELSFIEKNYLTDFINMKLGRL